MKTTNEPWEFVQDDEWEVADQVVDQIHEWGAGSIAVTVKDKFEQPMMIHAFALVGPYEVAVRVDPKTGNVLWAYRKQAVPGECGDPECLVLHGDPQNPIHPPNYVDSRDK